jgi:hypothetical protein
MEHRGWRRLWVPSYFCQLVVSSLLSTGIPIKTYPSRPGEDGWEALVPSLRAGDAVLRINYFGLQGKPVGTGPIPDGIDIIENHTHDPWSSWAEQSDADWCVASFRKTLPLPDGGALWSPRGHPLPAELAPTSDHCRISLEKLASMVMKGMYLQGHTIRKEVYRSLSHGAESEFAQGNLSGMPAWTRELLQALPFREWREHRARNHRALYKALSATPWVRMPRARDGEGSVPFGAVLCFDTARRRAHVQGKLIEEGVYPAVLWPLEQLSIRGVTDSDVEWSRRMLFIHCDVRYDTADMEFIASMVGRFGDEVSSDDVAD